MAPIRNARVLFNEIPSGYPEPGKTTVYDESQTIDLDNVPLNGSFLMKTLILSVDPYLRGRMRPANVESYAPPYHLGEPLDSLGVGVVIRSEHPGFEKGDHIHGDVYHQEYNIIENFDVTENPVKYRKLDASLGLPWTVYVGAAGMPGKTAFAGWKTFARAQTDGVAFVSAAAGPVGSMVVQLAKQGGMEVIACAGTEEKVRFVKSLGADRVFNYHEEDTAAVLKESRGIDVYWDSVGGDMLDAALLYSKVGARFIECSMISGYNSGYTPIKNINKVLENEISMNGFIVFHLPEQIRNEFYDIVPQQLASGKLKYTEEVTKGLDKVGDVILANQKGENKAKCVILVAED